MGGKEIKMLTIDKICVSYKRKGKQVPVLQDFSLRLKQGEVLAVLGASGCGKSTLIQVLAGMHPMDSGTVTADVRGEMLSLNPKTHKIAVIPQNLGLLPWKTIRQNCLLPLQLHKLPIDAKKLEELEDTCRSLKVDSFLESYPRELSGGQQQRVALARAFLQEPDLLLMDEPFSSLDMITRSEAWELFLNIWRRKQPTTILVTHSMEEALYLGKEIAVLDKEKGSLLEQEDNPYFGLQEAESGELMHKKRELKELLKLVSFGE